MNDGLIPQRYAKALYKFAIENVKSEVVYEEMKVVVSSFEANPDLLKVLANPYVSKDDKGNLLLAAAGDKREEAYENFVKLILENKRECDAYHCALAYRQIYRKENNISQVEVVTAAKLGDDELNKICNLVQESYKGKTLEFTYTINPDIIGGFIINVDSIRMDASISNEIEQLRLNLLSRN
jgi:F-type H+-transporting ATPase subunit delta